MGHKNSTRIFITLILFFLGQIANAEILKLVVSDTVVCEGSTLNLKTDASPLNNLRWEYYADDKQQFKTFSTDVSNEVTYEMKDAACFRVSSTINGKEVHSNVECVSIVTPYESNWYAYGEKIESGYELKFCDDIKNLGIHAEGGDPIFDKYFGNEFYVDGVLVSTDTLLIIPSVKAIKQVVHIETSTVCPADTFVFNFKSLEKPKIRITSDLGDNETICLGGEVNIKVNISGQEDFDFTVSKGIDRFSMQLFDVYFDGETLYEENVKGKIFNYKFVPTEPTSYDAKEESENFYQITASRKVEEGGIVYCESRDSIIVQVEKPYIPTIGLDTIYVCSDNKNYSIDLMEGLTFQDKKLFRDYKEVEWYMGNRLVSDKYKFSLPEFSDSCKITQIVSGVACPDVKTTYNFKERKNPHIQLEQSSFSICENDIVSIPFTSTAATSYSVLHDGSKTNITPEQRDGKLYHSIQPDRSTKLQIVASNGECASEQSEVDIDVRKQISVQVDTNIDEHGSHFCLGSDEHFEAGIRMIAGMAESVTWKANGKIISNAASISSEVLGNTTYELEVKNGVCPSYQESFDVSVINKPDINVSDVTVCEGETATISADFDRRNRCMWYSEAGELLSTKPSMDVLSMNDATYTVLVKPIGDDSLCYSKTDVTLHIQESPKIISTEKLNETTYRMLTEGGSGSLTYDYGTGEVTSNEFDLQPARSYNIKVTDELGCQSDYLLSTDGYELSIPPYFVANRENWMIENIDKFPNASVNIYDRTGKLLLSTADFTYGWNGEYNGHNMPSTDYWYVINLPGVDEQKKGHFTLLRE